MPKIIIPIPYREHTDNQADINLTGENLKEFMEGLWRQYPGMKTILDDSALLSIFVNNKLVTTGIEKWGEVSLDKGDEIALIIPIAGGYGGGIYDIACANKPHNTA